MEETQRSQQQFQDRKHVSRVNGCTDILELLSKAKVEYERSCQSIPKHLTVEELFGTSLPKENSTAPMSNPERIEKIDTSCREHNLLLPFSFEQSTVIHQPLGKLDAPSLKHNSLTLLPQECVPSVLTSSPSVLQPEVNKVSNYNVHLSPILNSTLATEAPCGPVLQNINANNNVMQVMQQTTKPVPSLVNQPLCDMNHGTQNLSSGQNQFLGSMTLPNTGDVSNTSLSSVDFLQKLRLTPQHDQMQQSLIKPPVAPNAAAAISQLATPDCFKESHNKTVLYLPKVLSKANQVASTQFATTSTTIASSVLLSPSVFQQSTMKSSEIENKVGSLSPVILGTDVQMLSSAVLSRSQLQQTLIHLIKVELLSHNIYLLLNLFSE
uniref:Decapping mRNA 1A n=1 Tax=Laticauda laticaudata TaxID=8630 RepID=A0A8C5SEJ0_LATLA